MTNTRKRFRALAAFVAGIHTANGLAHGVPPAKESPARVRRHRTTRA